MITSIWCNELITRGHILIAGTSGAGKSVLLNDIIASILCKDPTTHRTIFLDPKLCEFEPYRHCVHTMALANETNEIAETLDALIVLMNERIKINRDNRETMYRNEWGPRIHLIIDEFADMMLDNEAKKVLRPKLQRLMQKSRAANIQIIAATQCPLTRVIPTEIKVNFEISIGLRTLNTLHSRNILDVKGCESLPMYGKALVHDPKEYGVIEKDIPFIPREEILALALRRTPADKLPKSTKVV